MAKPTVTVLVSCWRLQLADGRTAVLARLQPRGHHAEWRMKIETT